jgi:site-specific DNA recombinase
MSLAIYVRVSTQRQAQSQTIEQQLQRVVSYIEERGWSLPPENIYKDDGYSGSKLSRPGLDQLRDQVQRGEIDWLLMTAPDRLARKYVHQVFLLEELEGSGCKVEFLDRPMSEDPHDQLLLQIRGAVAEYERTLITERMRRGRLIKLQAGTLLPWSKAPFGYRADSQHPRDPALIRIEESEAAVVAEIFGWYLEDGATLREVGLRLQGHGCLTPGGQRRWAISTIKGILSNPVYTGVVYGGRMRVCEARRRRSPLQVRKGSEQKSHCILPREQWIEIARIPAIVSEQEYEAVQAKLRQNQKFASRNNKSHEYLLRALVSCGRCQLACIGRTCNTGHTYYRCQGKRDQLYSAREERCQSRLIPAKQLDELVWRDLCEVIRHPKLIARALKRAHAGNWLPQQLQSRLATLRKGQANLEHQVERLTDAYLSEVIKLAEYQRRRGEIEQKIGSLMSQEQQVMAQVERQVEIAELAGTIEEFCRRVDNGLAKATFEQRRELVELLIDRVVVADEEVEIRYVIPTTASSEQVRFCHLCSDYQSVKAGMKGGNFEPNEEFRRAELHMGRKTNSRLNRRQS